MSDTDHKQWQDDIAAYLLGALDPGEAAELERHIAGCAECQADLRRLGPAVDLLPESVKPVEPPADLRVRLIEQTRAEAAQTVSDPQRQMPFSRRRWFSGWRPVAAGVAAALMLVAAVGLATRDAGTGDGATTVTAGEPPAVTAELVMDGDSATLQLANVHDMPENRVLEAWVQRDGEVTPVRGLFVPDRSGRATATIPDMDGVEAVMVTSEPEGGSAAPTSAPMVTLEI